MRIAIDLDGVLANSMKVWLKIWYEKTGQIIEYQEVNEWFFWRKLGMDSRRFMQILNEAWSRWLEIPPMEESLNLKTRQLKTLGRLDIVTARPRKTERYVYKWLSLHKIVYDKYVWVKRGEDKVKLDYDVFIDDSPTILADLDPARRSLILIYDQPWNRNINEGDHVKRVKNLDEAYLIIRSLKECEKDSLEDRGISN
ncbi:MAG: hypothetical protein QXE67_02175 [Nitrososphaerota archaeon]|nr:hypothetical protein [Candidatus Geocrenenecus dongiae]